MKDSLSSVKPPVSRIMNGTFSRLFLFSPLPQVQSNRPLFRLFFSYLDFDLDQKKVDWVNFFLLFFFPPSAHIHN